MNHGSIISIYDMVGKFWKSHISTDKVALDNDQEAFGKADKKLVKMFRHEVTKGLFNIGVLYNDGSFDLLELIEYNDGKG